MNLISLEGNLTRDFEIKEIGSSTLYSSSIACNEKRNEKDYVFFVSVQAWNNTGKWLEKTFSKGDKIRFFGKFDNQQWDHEGQKRQKAVITINQFDFPARRKDESQPAASDAPPLGVQMPSDDEIPF